MQKSSGNYALHDVIAALQWVKANISAFGGDPANVTLYSESAGAGLSSVLLASPPACGLFHRLVTESLAALPAGTPNTTLAQAEVAGKTYAANVGASDLAAPIERLGFRARSESVADFARLMQDEYAKWGPIVKETGFTAEE